MVWLERSGMGKTKQLTMNIKLNVEVTTPKTLAFAPQKLELWISNGSVIQEGVECKEVLAETCYQMSSLRTIIDRETFYLPITSLQGMISSYDLAKNEPVINMQMLDGFLQSQYNLRII